MQKGKGAQTVGVFLLVIGLVLVLFPNGWIASLVFWLISYLFFSIASLLENQAKIMEKLGLLTCEDEIDVPKASPDSVPDPMMWDEQHAAHFEAWVKENDEEKAKRQSEIKKLQT